MFDVRLAHRSNPMPLDELRDSQKALPNVLRERAELSLHTLVQDLDTPNHFNQDIPKKRFGQTPSLLVRVHRPRGLCRFGLSSRAALLVLSQNKR
jgi:hypothetical protein